MASIVLESFCETLHSVPVKFKEAIGFTMRGSGCAVSRSGTPLGTRFL